ncbi:MAG TPA: Ldh family oxidoreductase [Actinomycetospora sp.]|nr:Ldh family oxidoreductase [Actinomycetospora sp.]
MDDVVRVEAVELERLARRVLEGVGTPAVIAAVVAGSLVGADLAGHGSHGVRRLEPYAAFVRSGQIVPDARATVETAHGATAVVDGHYGFGQPAARVAVDVAAERAAEHGTAIVAVRRCNHVGRLGEYVEALARRGLVASAFCHADPTVAPFGGRGRRLGTNPLAWAAPAGDGAPPLVLDWATSASAEGKLAVARARGEQVPPDVLVDAAGAPSTDPQDFYDGGALLPFGGHKGYALSLMIDVVGGLLTGAGAASLPGYDGTNGTVLVAHDVARFTPLAGFTEQVEALRAELHATPPAPGSDGVLLPGEPEEAARRHHLAQGVDVPATTWAALNDLVPHTAGEQR